MRRLFVDNLHAGLVELDDAQSRHARSALRLGPGDRIELITPSGLLGTGAVATTEPRVVVEVDTLAMPTTTPALLVASAVPKGDRADWLVEKLSEIGVAAWTPLRTARSVVHPDGDSKFDRWRRIAIEASKQSKRVGVMRIDPLLSLNDLLARLPAGGAVCLSTGPEATPLANTSAGGGLTLLVGPEGGWTEEELERMAACGLTCAALGPTILRVETAAVVAAGMMAAMTRP